MAFSVDAIISKYSTTTHSVAIVFASLVTAYAAVPAFHTFVLSIYNHVPACAQSAVLAALGLYAWYRNGESDAPAPAAKTWYQQHKNQATPPVA
jgi:hypothetical protein